MIDLTPQEFEIVRAILAAHVPDREVWVYGSRVTGRRKAWSDLDLAVIGDTPLGFTTMTALEWDFEMSDLPFKVDVTDFAAASREFRERISARHERLVPGSAEMSADFTASSAQSS